MVIAIEDYSISIYIAYKYKVNFYFYYLNNTIKQNKAAISNKKMETIKYRIQTTTSNFPKASLSANAFLQVFGTQKPGDTKIVSIRFPLQHSKNHSTKFQPGQTDIFEHEDLRIHKIKKIRLNHEARNTKWHLKSLVIQLPDGGSRDRANQDRGGDGKAWKFYCNKWIVGGEKSAGVDLEPLKTNSDEYDSIEIVDERLKNKEKEKDKEKHDKSKDVGDGDKKKGRQAKYVYRIKIVTSEFSKMDANMKLKFKIVGKDGETGWIKVEDFSPVNIFKVEENDVGEVDKLLISCHNDENGKTVDWFFDQIVVAIHKFKTFM